MFNIDYITILPGNKYNKNLIENHPYSFNIGLEDGFFGKNINVHAIVGKNGSGKSSLLEIMFRLINNLSYVLLRDIPHNAAKDIRYIFDLYAEIGWTIEKMTGTLRCEDTKVFFKIDGILENTFTIDKNTGRICLWDRLDKEYSLMKSIADNFFYTVVLNYSMQSFVAQEYVGEYCKSKMSNRHKSLTVDDVWINALFHKNDGYMCPINLNPYRDKGCINTNKEMILARERVASLLEYFKQDNIPFIDGYMLIDVSYSFNYIKINSYFDSAKLVDLENEMFPTTDEKELEFRKNTENTEGYKTIRIQKLFILAIESKKNNISKTVLNHYGIDTTLRDDTYVICMIYLVCKVLNIGLVYPKYLFLTRNGKTYTYCDALAEENEDAKIKIIESLLYEIDNDYSHITKKLRRAVLFFKNYRNLNNQIKFQVKLIDDYKPFTGTTYREGLGIKRGTHLTLKEIEQTQPISIFEPLVYLMALDENKKPIRAIIELNRLSSGERQYIFTLSSIVYHITNLLSVKDENPKYRNFNIIIDELEICMHPDYQRMFLSKMLGLLKRLELNKDPLNLNIIFCTHSPFTLSDIPKQNILYLDNGRDVSEEMKQETFGANVNELLAESFFLSRGFMGEFAKNKILSLIAYLDKEDTDEGYWTDEKAKRTIDLVGDEVISYQLKCMYGERHRHTGEDTEAYKNWIREEAQRLGI